MVKNKLRDVQLILDRLTQILSKVIGPKPDQPNHLLGPDS